MAKKNTSRQKKVDLRVDFTPMVDMMMLLITFFMLCTSLSKPQAMLLTMPSNDQNVQEQDKTATKASQTLRPRLRRPLPSMWPVAIRFTTLQVFPTMKTLHA